MGLGRQSYHMVYIIVAPTKECCQMKVRQQQGTLDGMSHQLHQPIHHPMRYMHEERGRRPVASSYELQSEM